jgi:hypothetical protein
MSVMMMMVVMVVEYSTGLCGRDRQSKSCGGQNG